ncbi:MAG: bifunctional molybdenum cofactor biosynthesis protein MoaC/MoaB [Rhodospirillales bacterium]|nr:bifunctional molybdenum cofactor biosynthesis protein MoaC/MoaB [Alphaproteobacteria bacterium]MCB9986813.1 bifunctional molybdenum cofactor biosynthesis protein MoaC/MoaB [Rhodospirillales bacterium]USO08422.1 MAG: bifunctional molybdenum cofactor biosynthesis protein MoaC/MoaB [Rhodospirillales bacterium]
MTFKMPEKGVSRFGMIDVGKKRPTRRVAVATGRIVVGCAAFEAIERGALPKGDVLALAEAAAIAGAKNTPQSIPMCHAVPLDMAGAHFVLDVAANAVDVIVQCVAIAKTGVEMEALAGVNAALLTIWDLTKGTNPALQIEGVRLLAKTGGKSGAWKNPEGVPAWLEVQLLDTELKGIKAAVLVMSDRASAGVYDDKSGKFLLEALKADGADVVAYQVIPDEKVLIAKTIKDICVKHSPQVLLASGGTGPSPRDVTPEVLKDICAPMLDGIGEWLRQESGFFTETAWLSRMCAGIVDETLVIALPGSPKAVAECWQMLQPVLSKAVERIAKQMPARDRKSA